MRKPDIEDQKPGPVWGGWWFWEAPPGKVMESEEDTFQRLGLTTVPALIGRRSYRDLGER